MSKNSLAGITVTTAVLLCTLLLAGCGGTRIDPAWVGARPAVEWIFEADGGLGWTPLGAWPREGSVDGVVWGDDEVIVVTNFPTMDVAINSWTILLDGRTGQIRRSVKGSAWTSDADFIVKGRTVFIKRMFTGLDWLWDKEVFEKDKWARMDLDTGLYTEVEQEPTGTRHRCLYGSEAVESFLTSPEDRAGLLQGRFYDISAGRQLLLTAEGVQLVEEGEDGAQQVRMLCRLSHMCPQHCEIIKDTPRRLVIATGSYLICIDQAKLKSADRMKKAGAR